MCKHKFMWCIHSLLYGITLLVMLITSIAYEVNQERERESVCMCIS